MEKEEFKALQKALKLKNYQICQVFGKTLRTIVSYRTGTQEIPNDLANLLMFLTWLNNEKPELWEKGKKLFFLGVGKERKEVNL
ncbi:MAG: hypothetical protein A2511_05800 [Deltaproteobacteria bacterium RIFOXYD12_FULL_50_9]|nr:MAG: hypothetical protein A2511_05800 [Deltaproteobacteria bacterium RIFOXYD12_FULL_50_9]